MAEPPAPSSSSNLPKRVGLQGNIFTEPRTDTGNMCPLSQLTQSPSAHLQLQGPHWIVQPGGQWGLDLKMEQLGWLYCGPVHQAAFMWAGLHPGNGGGNVQGLLLAGAAVASRG